MSTQVQRRKGTTVQHSTFTGASAELTVDTTKNTVVVHDGATAGGIPLAKETGSAISATSLSLPNSTTNGVAFVNSSKVVVAGSTFTFDGNNLSVNNITVGKGPGTGSFNTVVGQLALGANVSSSTNTAIGYNAMKTITTGSGNTAVGTVSLALALDTGNNTAIGWGALFPSTGTQNTALGFNAGGDMTLGSKNVIIGSFSGNDYLYGTGLDIRTLNNYIVLSDGDANVRAYWNGANPTFPGALTLSDGTANGVAYLNGSKVLTSGTALTFSNGNFLVNGAASGSALSGDASVAAIRDSATANVASYKVIGGSSNTQIELFGSGSTTGLWTSTNTPMLFAVNNTEAMRLTSTGLGIGTSSPGAKLHTSGTGSTPAIFERIGANGSFIQLKDASGNSTYIGSTNGVFSIQTPGSGYSDKMVIDASGNFGLGVVPSAWMSSYKAIELVGGWAALSSNDGFGTAHLTSNCYATSTSAWAYTSATSYRATRYQSGIDGIHAWFNSAPGTAGNPITFTQAMTLDASGNLLVGTTSPVSGGGVLQLKSGITFPATQVASSDANTLDDYEEGTWTPTQGAGLTVVGTFSSSGSYTKVGQMVTVRGRVSGSTSVSITANSVLCGSLPFTGTTGADPEVGSLTNLLFTQVGVVEVYSNDLYSTAMTATTRLNFSITYFV